MSSSSPQLNADVLEKIFLLLPFRDLLAVELVCKTWKEVVDSRRVYKQLARRICRKAVNLPGLVTKNPRIRTLADLRKGAKKGVRKRRRVK